jgi:hypothetical protein
LENWRSALADFNRVEHPVLNVTINGEQPERRPSVFTLHTDEGLPNIESRLDFPSDSAQYHHGDEVVVKMLLGNEESLVFTGAAYWPYMSLPRRNFLLLTDGYGKLRSRYFISTYRKEQAKVILQDLLDKAGITKTSITCPPVLLHRFSTNKIAPERTIRLLIEALEEHGHEGLRFFFDEKDVFHFGTEKDTGRNEGEVYEFETGKNIIEKEDGMIKVLPLPVRHTQKVLVDGETFITSRTHLQVSGKHSYLKLWLREDK